MIPKIFIHPLIGSTIQGSHQFGKVDKNTAPKIPHILPPFMRSAPRNQLSQPKLASSDNFIVIRRSTRVIRLSAFHRAPSTIDLHVPGSNRIAIAGGSEKETSTDQEMATSKNVTLA
jgi:hypothetical protein